MNNVNIAGRVAKDPDTRGSVTTLIVATDRVPFPEPPATASEACTLSPRVATRSRAIARGFALRPLWVGMQ